MVGVLVIIVLARRLEMAMQLSSIILVKVTCFFKPNRQSGTQKAP